MAITENKAGGSIPPSKDEISSLDYTICSDDEFIENQIQFQLGSFGKRDFSIPVNDLCQATKFPSAIFGVYDALHSQVLKINDCHKLVKVSNNNWKQNFAVNSVEKKGRIAYFLNSLSAFSPKSLYPFDFQDARGRSTGNWLHGKEFPVFQFNRLSRNRDSILWPLKDYHDIDNPYFLEHSLSDPVSFEDKEPRICWRGMLTGSGFDKERKTNVGIHKLKADFSSGAIDAEEIRRQLLLIKRYKFVAKFSNNDIFDVGFSYGQPHQEFITKLEGVSEFVKNPLTKLEHCKFRYLVALSGWDYATSLYWMLSTNSVVFKEEYEYEVFADCHLKPWVHYVPISPSFDDVIDKYEWCEANKSQCLLIVENAKAVCQMLIRSDLREKILGAVVSRYDSRCHI